MSILDSVKGAITSGASSITKGAGTAFDLLNPSKTRLNIAGLFPGGGKSSGTPTETRIGFQSGSGSGGATAAAEDDWRVRISLGENSKIFYKDNENQLLAPLIATNGVIFPYTPSIAVTHTANYGSNALTHSNYDHPYYQNSVVNDITISGEFTVQNNIEGQYLMAAIYFLRSATKMFFGQGGAEIGNPPPVVFLDGYGSHYFPHIPCVITTFTHTLPADADYIQVPITKTALVETARAESTGSTDPVTAPDNAPNWNLVGVAGNESAAAKLAANNAKSNKTSFGYSSITTTTRVPTVSTISITLKPIYSRKNVHDNFNLKKFANGDLLGGKDRGGFL